MHLPSVVVKEGLSCVIFRDIVARKTPNLALPSFQHSVHASCNAPMHAVPFACWDYKMARRLARYGSTECKQVEGRPERGSTDNMHISTITKIVLSLDIHLLSWDPPSRARTFTLSDLPEGPV